jgi:hypothetical protein
MLAGRLGGGAVWTEKTSSVAGFAFEQRLVMNKYVSKSCWNESSSFFLVRAAIVKVRLQSMDSYGTHRVYINIPLRNSFQ